MRKLFPIFFLWAFAISASAAEVRLSAAASFAEGVKELVSAYGRSNPGVTVTPNFGSSGALARQIGEGAPADIFISANRKWMDHLVREKLVSPQAVRALAENTLLFVGAGGTRASSLKDLPALRRIALGNPQCVPAGEYARQALEKGGVWERLASGGKLVLTGDVRQALLHAERGEVDGAFVYRTDALLAREAKVLFEVPRELHEPVSCQVALTVRGARNPSATAFFNFLTTPEAKRILRSRGFVVN